MNAHETREGSTFWRVCNGAVRCRAKELPNKGREPRAAVRGPRQGKKKCPEMMGTLSQHRFPELPILADLLMVDTSNALLTLPRVCMVCPRERGIHTHTQRNREKNFRDLPALPSLSQSISLSTAATPEEE